MLYLGKPGIHPRAWRQQSEENGFNLNVFVPEDTKPNEKLPVMVRIQIIYLPTLQEKRVD